MLSGIAVYLKVASGVYFDIMKITGASLSQTVVFMIILSVELSRISVLIL